MIGHRLRPYARLLRLPNVFTVPGDVAVGYWVLDGAGAFVSPRLGWAIAAGCAIYLAGMIWNDVFDLEIDRKERPERPLPSAEISVPTAIFLGAIALIVGMLAAGLAGPMTALAGGALALLVLLYDWTLKNTLAGPVAMGACRSASVVLGMSAAWLTTDVASQGRSWMWLVAIANGVYIAGVTILAKREATTSRRRQGVFAVVLMVMGLALHVGVWQALAPSAGWGVGILLVYLGWLGVLLASAIGSLQPPAVQAAVKGGILGIIAIDAAVAAAFVGPSAGVAILLFFVPALWLGRWVYST